MKEVSKHFKGSYKELILGPIFKLMEAVFELMVPMVMVNIIDVGIANKDSRYIIIHGLLLLLLAVLGIVAAILCQYYAAKAGGRFGRSLRNEAYSHVMKLSAEDTAKFGSSGLIVRLTNDINLMQVGVNMVIRLGTRAPFLGIGSIVMACILDMKIGVIFIITTPIIAIVLYLIMKYTLPSYKKIQDSQDRLSKLSLENLEGIRVIRAFSRQKQEHQGYEMAQEDLARITIRAGRISAVLNPLTTLIVNIAIALIVWMGSSEVNIGNMEPGVIVAMVSYMNQTLMALMAAANLIVLFTRAIASAKRVEEVLETRPSIVRENIDESPVESSAAIEFKDVSFSYYKGAEPALENISLNIAKGETIGLIGGTGSGKSTIANLIIRFYDATEGTVLFDGRDVKSYEPTELRQHIGLVAQKAVLFRGTIRENMQMASPAATDEEIWQALETAQAKSFVSRLSMGLDAHVEEEGKNYSGGQRQRLTIARALLKKPELLILDDSASALDFATDAALRKSLRAEMESRPEMTVIIISQRVGSIRNADSILVLDDSRLVGAGSHEKLAEDNLVYREICRSQGIELYGEVRE